MKIVGIAKKYPLQLLLILACSSCTAPRRMAAPADAQRYGEYSKKLGIQLQGNENGDLLRSCTQWLGTPYRYGGTTRQGIDCSAFVGAVYREALGVTLPRTSSAIAKSLTGVSRSNLACGDILFFTNKEKRVSHVGIYIAEGKFVHSASSSGVSVASLNSAYWSSYYAGAGRVKGVPAPTPPPSAERKPSGSTGWAAQRAAGRSSKPRPGDKATAPSRASEAEAKDRPGSAKPAPSATAAATPERAAAADKAAGTTEKALADGLIIVFDNEF